MESQCEHIEHKGEEKVLHKKGNWCIKEKIVIISIFVVRESCASVFLSLRLKREELWANTAVLVTASRVWKKCKNSQRGSAPKSRPFINLSI